MKDIVHHRRHVQRKVLQSLRKEMEKEMKSKNDEDLDASPSLYALLETPKISPARRRELRVQARTFPR